MAGSTGWAIKGNGTAEFANTSIRGTITANAVTTTGLTIYSNGAVTTTSGKFGVTAGGVLSATEANISGAITATSGTFTGTVNAAGGTMTGYLRAGDVFIGKNVYDASEHNGIGIDGSWNNAWVRRDNNDTTYFRAGSSSTYIQMDTGGTSAISFPNFSVDSSGNASFGGNLNSVTGKIDVGGIQLGQDVGPFPGHYGLSLSGSNFDNIFLKRNDGAIFFRVDTGTGHYIRFDNGTLNIEAYGTVRFGNNITIGQNCYIQASLFTDGNVRVNQGTNNPKTALNTKGDSSSASDYYALVAERLNGSNILEARCNGQVHVAGGSVYSTSDIRSKVNIQECDLGLDFIKALKPKSFNRIDNFQLIIQEKDEKLKPEPIVLEAKDYGFIAQEVKELIDELSPNFGGWEYTPETGYQSLGYTEFIAPIVKAIQELSAKVATLESKIV